MEYILLSLLYLCNLTVEGGDDDAGEGIAGVGVIEWKGPVLCKMRNYYKIFSMLACLVMLLFLTVNTP